MSEPPKDEGNPGPYITRSECASQRAPVIADITIIKKALVGEDLRGGIVKACTVMQEDIKEMKKSINDANHKQEKKQELALKYKIVITAAVISAGAVLGAEIIKLVATVL